MGSLVNIMKMLFIAVADPGFPREGDASHKDGAANLLFSPISPQNCMKMKKNWTRGPLGSANAWNKLVKKNHHKCDKSYLEFSRHSYVQKGNAGQWKAVQQNKHRPYIFISVFLLYHQTHGNTCTNNSV